MRREEFRTRSPVLQPLFTPHSLPKDPFSSCVGLPVRCTQTGGLKGHENCYDNEAYGNTGFQMSGASPYASQTATSPVGKEEPEGTFREKKDIFEIWRAHKPPYVATVSSLEAIDLVEKVHRALSMKGPKLFLALAVCPTGWGFDPRKADELARLAVQTGIWPLKEARNGQVRHTYIPSRFKPVEEYLRPQLRFRHLFEPERNVKILEYIQQRVDQYWEHVKKTETP